MKVIIDVDSPVPAYEQLRAQITALVQGGNLTPGTRLPPVRQLAGDLNLAPGTVARAYQILEATGITQGQRRRGTIVLAQPDGLSAQDNQLMAAARAYAATIRELGLDSATAHAAIDSALQEMRPPLH